MFDLSLFNFTHDEVKEYLHSATRKIDFRFELFAADGTFKKDLTTIETGTVDFNSEAAIKRSAKISMKEDPDINYLSDRIKPYVRFFIDKRKMSEPFTSYLSASFPASFDKQMLGAYGWVDFPLGVFLLTSPTRKDNGPFFTREIECYDGCLVLQEDRFEERHFIPNGMSVRDAVIEILEMTGITNYEIDESIKAVEADMEFAVGENKLVAINSLLVSSGYEELTTDSDGNYIAKLYANPAESDSDYSYKTDQYSVVFSGYEEKLDFYQVPNKWIVTRSMADRPPLISVYTNSNPDSPTSTVSRGRTSMQEPITVDNIPDQQSLDLYVERIAYEQSQIFGEVTFETSIMPFHGFKNILDIEFDGLIGNGKYQELSWSIPLETGGKMKHLVRRINPI